MVAWASGQQSSIRAALVSFGLTVLVGCASQQTSPISVGSGETAPGNVDNLLIVDCLLPGQIRKLGRNFTYLTPRRAIKSAASECEIRGGEYTSYDRANFATALKIWLPQAQAGDAEAQTYVGEIYEKGLGLESDYSLAALWYGKAADQGYSRAQINLGFLHESGLGVPQDLTRAMNLYRAASGFREGELEYVSSIEAANRVVREQERVDLKDQVATLELANAELREKQGQIDRERSELARLSREVEEQRALVLEAQNALTDRTSDSSSAESLDSEALANAEARAQSSTAQLGQTLAELEQAGEALKSAEAREEQLRAELEAQRVRTAQLQSQVNADNAELRGKSRDLATSEQQIARLSARIQALEADSRSGTDSLAQRLSEERSAADLLRQEVTRLQASQSDASRELQRQLDSAREKENGLSARLSDELAQVRALQNQLTENEARYSAELERLRGQLATARDEQRALGEQALDQQERLETAQAEQRRLSERVMLGEIDAEQQAVDAARRLAALEAQLEEKQSIIARQQNDIESLQNNVTQVRASLEDRDIEKVNQVVAAGPTIEIIEPPVLVSRGKPSLKSLPGNSEMDVIGRIDPLDSLLTFKINGQTLQVNDNGVFVHKVRPADVSTLQMVAVSDAGERTDLEFSVVGSALTQGAEVTETEAAINPDSIAFGNYHALIIGNNQYEGFHDLKSAEADALAMEKLLRERYGFKTELLLNGTRYDILSAMNRKREQLTEKDNLLIYYAGHGELSNGKGYWMPVDAEPNSTTNWISNTSITDLVESMSAKHVMVIADSCYSGSLTRSSLARVVPGMSSETKLKWYSSVAALKVRTVLSSGGVKPVLDSTGDSRHSLFAQALLDELGSADGIVEAYELFLKVQRRVKQGARQFNLDQNPQYSPIKHAGHESGEFLFVNRSRAVRAPADVESVRADLGAHLDPSS